MENGVKSKHLTFDYDWTGNITTGLDGSLYSYDAQNRLISATKTGTTDTFKYDALNRQVTRTILLLLSKMETCCSMTTGVD